MGTTSPLRGLLQVDEHDVVAAGLELQGLAGLHLEARHGAHLHHVVVHHHLVQFDHVGGRAGHADQAHAALAAELHEGAGGLLGRDGAAHPGILDFQVGGGTPADSRLVSARAAIL
jgi:hypothetical protein